MSPLACSVLYKELLAWQVSFYCSYWWALEEVLLIRVICHPELYIIPYFYFRVCLLAQYNFLRHYNQFYMYSRAVMQITTKKYMYIFCFVSPETIPNTRSSAFFVVVQIYPCSVLLASRIRTQIHFFSGTDSHFNWSLLVSSGREAISVVQKKIFFNTLSLPAKTSVTLIS